MTARLTFSGGPALEAALRELGGKIAGRLGSNATRAGARVIVNQAKARVPVDTGALKRSIRTFTDPAGRGGSTRTAYAGSRARHAHLVEFGTRFMPARSFLRSALDEAGQAAVDKMAENLGKGIIRETAKYKGR